MTISEGWAAEAFASRIVRNQLKSAENRLEDAEDLLARVDSALQADLAADGHVSSLDHLLRRMDSKQRQESRAERALAKQAPVSSKGTDFSRKPTCTYSF